MTAVADRRSRSAPKKDQSWRSSSERGSILGIRAVLFMTTAFGRAPAKLFVRVLAFYYTLFAGSARSGVRSYLVHLGEEPTFGRVYTQILRFSLTILDALFLVQGKTQPFVFDRTGSHHLAELRQNRRGAILLGAHLGSFYAMRAKSGEEALPLHPVVYTKHAQRINTILDEIAPDSKVRLIQMGEGVEFMLKIKELLEQGALIAILADRVGSDDRATEATFLGEKARFPTGPYILASALKCPVYLTFGIYREPNKYELHCEPFADRIELPRKDRQGALGVYVQRYADRLESYVRSAPDNWFNFYDFWGRKP